MDKVEVNELVLITKGSIVDQVKSIEFNDILSIDVVRLVNNRGIFFKSDLQEPSNDQLAHHLKTIVENWIDRIFNYISLGVYEACFPYLSDHIEPLNTSEIEEKIEELEEIIEDLNNDIDNLELDITYPDDEILIEKLNVDLLDKQRELDGQKEKLEDLKQELVELEQEENYPLWGTVFELKSEWGNLTNKAQELGMGLINSTELFNSTLFMTSGGHSFYSAYWIPLYLELFPNEKKLYKNVNY